MKRNVIGKFKVTEGKDKYGKDLIEDLRKYCTEEEYDFESALHLFKLYSFYPEETDYEVVGRLLMKMMTALPDTDFQTSLYVLPKEMRNESYVNIPMKLHTYLDTGRFQFFWEDLQVLVHDEQVLIEDDFYEKIRDFIFGVLSITYQSIKEKKFLTFMNLREEELTEELCQKYEIKKEEDMIKFSLNRHNEKRVFPKKKVEIEDLEALLLDSLKV